MKDFDMSRFTLTEADLRKWRAERAKRLLRMTPEERRAHEEAQEADAWREALSDEFWGKS